MNLKCKVAFLLTFQLLIPLNSYSLDKQQEKESQFAEVSNKVYSYKKLETELKSLSVKNDLIQLETIGKTTEDRNIYLVRLGKKNTKKKSRVLAIFAQHAEEHDTTLLAMDLIKNILNKNQLNKYLDNTEICIVPMLNPDGVDFDLFNNQNEEFYWRKNRLALSNGNFGVDLNRNWSYKWNSEIPSDFKNNFSDINSKNYIGSKPFSENETKSIKDFLAKNKVDLFLDYHSGLSTFNQGMILIPFTYTENIEKNNAVKEIYKDLPFSFAKLVSDTNSKREEFTVMQTQDNRPYIEKKLREIVPKEHLNQALSTLPKSFITPGSSIDYTFGELGIISIALEISRNIDFYQKYNDKFFDSQIKGFEYLLDYVSKKSL